MRFRLLLCSSMVMGFALSAGLCGAQTTASAVVSVSVRVEPAITLASLGPVPIGTGPAHSRSAAAMLSTPSVLCPVDPIVDDLPGMDPWGFGCELPEGNATPWVEQEFLTNDSRLHCRASFVCQPTDSETENRFRKKLLVWVVLPAD